MPKEKQSAASAPQNPTLPPKRPFLKRRISPSQRADLASMRRDIEAEVEEMFSDPVLLRLLDDSRGGRERWS